MVSSNKLTCSTVSQLCGTAVIISHYFYARNECVQWSNCDGSLKPELRLLGTHFMLALTNTITHLHQPHNVHRYLLDLGVAHFRYNSSHNTLEKPSNAFQCLPLFRLLQQKSLANTVQLFHGYCAQPAANLLLGKMLRTNETLSLCSQHDQCLITELFDHVFCGTQFCDSDSPAAASDNATGSCLQMRYIGLCAGHSRSCHPGSRDSSGYCHSWAQHATNTLL